MERTSFLLTFSAAAVAAALYIRYRRTEKSKDTLRIGTRKSDLAMVQARYVVSLLQNANPGLNVKITQKIEAVGDVRLDQSLKELAAQVPGLFSKHLELCLLANGCDAVVHSLKDMPTTLPDKLTLAAITEREDPRDALVVHAKHKGKGGLKGLPKDAIIGTSSVRREAFIRRDFKGFQVKIIRGNVNSRLAKLDDGQYDAIILAVAGLKRLGKEFEERIEEYLEPPHFLYGVGQGSLGLQCREEDEHIVAILKSVEHWESAVRCKAERSLLKVMEAGCQVPLGVHTKVVNKNGEAQLSLACTVLSEDGDTSIHATMVGPADKPEELGQKLARKILLDGGKKILDSVNGADVEQVSARPNTYGSAEEPNIAARGPNSKPI
mmetsp:Transcript_5488/g.6620  ORF Transcript_5488/g.6620 Transcript_5488/m.6620 type:complete len:380 (-) Transcript_5488:168-1307(-)